MNLSDITPIIIGIIASLPGILALSSQNRKDKVMENGARVDNAGKITEQALKLLEPLSSRIRELEEKVKVLEENEEIMTSKIKEQDEIIFSQGSKIKSQENALKDFSQGIEKLINQLMSLGQTPVWIPKTKGE